MYLMVTLINMAYVHIHATRLHTLGQTNLKTHVHIYNAAHKYTTTHKLTRITYIIHIYINIHDINILLIIGI